MRLRRIILLVFSLFLLSITSVLAVTPPFAGGPITSPVGPRDPSIGKGGTHYGIDVGIDNTYIKAPTDGYVIHDFDPGGFGYYLVFEFGENTPWAGQCLVIGDLNAISDNFNHATREERVPVREGEIIGLIAGEGAGISTGAHAHIEYHPHGYGGSSTADFSVGEFLRDQLGVDLSGKLYGSDFSGHLHKDRGIPWNVEAMMALGNSINEVMKEYQGYASKALKNLDGITLNLFTALAVIDLTMMIILAGFHVTIMDLIPKFTKYAFFGWFLTNWDTVVNTIFKGFLVVVAGAYDGKASFADDVTQPQLLLQKAMHLIEPALNKIASFGAYDYLTNLGTVLPIQFCAIIIMIVFTLTALYIMLCYLEFYISAAMNIVTVPFGVLHWTKFVPEGSLGHLLASTLKLMLITVLVGLATISFKDADVGELFSATVDATEATTGHPSDPTGNGYVEMIYEESAKFGVDGNFILAIAMIESGGNTIDGIHMTQNWEGSGASGIMQVMPEQDGLDGINGNRISIEKTYPNYRTDPRQNIDAGIAVFLDKLQGANGNYLDAAYAYNGEGEAARKYRDQVAKNYANITGGDASALYSNNKNPHKITADQMIQFVVLTCTLCGFAWLILRVPNRIMNNLKGSVELP
ncbi:type IV secretion system protein [Veillonella magna]|uniref:Type IV secretion system protein n=1 Tax=Veillonella magna TaxID=464322 RepID=A0ABS2GCM8_9FIRM|nr:type IV secretion system protein [Veillonella magna]MBM6823562.1 type IV secretion system protein [Veillonella magna]MBM6911906.1 type IV secretion system protein [Veillonella magna]